MSADNNSEENFFDNERTIPGDSPEIKTSYFAPGQLICDRYRVIGELGRGGMGAVFKCLDEVSGLEVALKTLARELSVSKFEMELVKTNFKMVYKLNHPNIAAYKNLEYDPRSGLYYLIMEYVDGEDLRYYLKNKRAKNEFSESLLIDLLAQIASALDYAHKENIIHRDIKPGNIMVDRAGQIKLLDFGLAAEIHSSLSRVSQYVMDVSGTLPYISPEQWRGKAATAASDQYSLAVMTYEIISGSVPFQTTDKDIMRDCALEETPDPLDTTEVINNAVAKAMSKLPEERFSSCGEFIEAMKRKRVVSPLVHWDSADQLKGGSNNSQLQEFVFPDNKKLSSKKWLKLRWSVAIVILLMFMGGLVNTVSEWLKERAEAEKQKQSLEINKPEKPEKLEEVEEKYSKRNINESVSTVSEFEKLRERAQFGSPIDQYKLGEAYELGKYVQKDMTQALYWYNRAAVAGYSDAALRLGVIYENMNNFPMASQCYQRAAALGNLEAQIRLDELNQRMMNLQPQMYNNNFTMF